MTIPKRRKGMIVTGIILAVLLILFLITVRALADNISGPAFCFHIHLLDVMSQT